MYYTAFKCLNILVRSTPWPYTRVCKIFESIVFHNSNIGERLPIPQGYYFPPSDKHQSTLSHRIAHNTSSIPFFLVFCTPNPQLAVKIISVSKEAVSFLCTLYMSRCVPLPVQQVFTGKNWSYHGTSSTRDFACRRPCA
jgi:hypothetical protein